MSQPNASPTVRRDLYQHVTNRILEDLERGVRPWLSKRSGIPPCATMLISGWSGG